MRRFGRVAHGAGLLFANLPLRLKCLLMVVIALAPMLMALLALTMVEQQSRRASSVVSETTAIHVEGQTLAINLRRAWNGVRRYQRLRTDADLEAFRGLEKQLTAGLTSLETRLIRRNEAPARLKRVRELVKQGQEQVAHLFRAGPFSSADELVIGMNRTLEAIRDEVARIEREQERFSVAALAQAEHVRFWSYLAVPFCVLLGVVGGVVTSLIAVSGFVRRIQVLQEDARQLAQGLAVPSREWRRDELGSLEESVWMAGNLLVAKEKELEDRVHQRTLELAKVNRDLETDIQQRKEAQKALHAAEALLQRQNHILEMIALGAPLHAVLLAVAQLVDLQVRPGCCSIHLLESDGRTLTMYAGPGLEPGLADLLASRPVAKGASPCAEAVLQRSRVVVEDLHADDVWKSISDQLIPYRIRSWWSTPVFGIDGKLIGAFAVLSDRPHQPDASELCIIDRAAHLARVAAERRRMEQDLLASTERFRLLVESTSDIISLIDSEGNALYQSPAMTRILGYEPGEPVASNGFNIIHPDELQEARANFERIVRRPGIHSPFERRVRHKDGSWRVLEIVVNNLLRDPSLHCLMVCARDISARKKAEIAMITSEERYRELFENATDILFTTGMTGRFTSVNKACEIATGYPREDLLRMNIGDLTAAPFQDLHRQTLARQIGGESGMTFEIELVAKGGTPTPVELSTRLIFRDGKPVGVQGIGRDVAERRQLEMQLRQAQKMEAIGLLAGGVAHDFNNLLTLISGYTQWMLEDMDESNPLRDSASEVLLAANRAATLTGQLLAFSRNQVIQPAQVDLNQLVANMDRMLRRVIGENVAMITIMSPNLAVVQVDAGQIEQVILNLVINARDAMPEGGKLVIETEEVELDESYARVHLHCPPGRYVMLAVSDSGVGMNEETRARIFEPFFTTKEIGRGTGLGLSTAYGIVKQSGGYIWVYSEVGVGTVFKVYFPVASPQTGLPVPAGNRSGRMAGSETILLVEDESNVRRMVRDMLRRQGYTILEAADGHVAQRIFENCGRQIHLLLSDVVMPEIGGRQLADRLQGMNAELKVLFMSGYTDDGVIHHRVLEPGTAFLQKPFTPDALARKVREVLDQV